VTATPPTPAGRSGWLVIVPVKGLDGAKSRLSTRPAGHRRDLALAFALDTVAAALVTRGVREVHVVSDDERVGNAVRALGAIWIEDPEAAGLNDAIRHAERELRRAHDDPDVVALAGDLPALRPDELAAALQEAVHHDRSFVPDAAGTGTTMLAARRTRSLEPLFGPRSCAAHAASGAARLDPGVAPGLRRDVDTEVDLWDAVRLGIGPATAAVLGL